MEGDPGLKSWVPEVFKVNIMSEEEMVFVSLEAIAVGSEIAELLNAMECCFCGSSKDLHFLSHDKLVAICDVCINKKGVAK